MHKFTNKKLPATFNQVFTAVTKIHSRCLRTQHTIKYIGVKIWNNIPKEIKKLSYTKFILSYKKFLLSKYNLK